MDTSPDTQQTPKVRRDTTPPPSSHAPPLARKAHLDAHPPPPTIPAYLATTTTSPLIPSPAQLYAQLPTLPRQSTPLTTFTLPPRSGRAFVVPAGSIVRISTPVGPQVGDLNIWSLSNSRERFWAARTRQLYASHVSVGDRLWSCLPYLRPLCTIVADSLGSWYNKPGANGVQGDAHGGRCHDLLGTRCDPYVNVLLSGEAGSYDFHCHSNLVRAVLPFGLGEADVHDVINLFQVTGLDRSGKYYMQASPAQKDDFIELFAETDLLMALSTCPGGDLSVWGFGKDKEMREVCRPLKVEVWELDDKGLLEREGWQESEVVKGYKGMHGMGVPVGEGGATPEAASEAIGAGTELKAGG